MGFSLMKVLEYGSDVAWKDLTPSPSGSDVAWKDLTPSQED